jgi:hypothetical protein
MPFVLVVGTILEGTDQQGLAASDGGLLRGFAALTLAELKATQFRKRTVCREPSGRGQGAYEAGRNLSPKPRRLA